jgi:ribosomal protein L40E
MLICGVRNMVYCSNCGEKLADEAYFCPKCGTKTLKGKEAKTPYPSSELEDAFYKVGLELERAFTIAANETHAALKKASDNFQGKTATKQQALVCPKCGSKNPTGAIFCNNCGSRIAPIEESHGGGSQ